MSKCQKITIEGLSVNYLTSILNTVKVIKNRTRQGAFHRPEEIKETQPLSARKEHVISGKTNKIKMKSEV